jgi:hypothetical protein
MGISRIEPDTRPGGVCRRRKRSLRTARYDYTSRMAIMGADTDEGGCD